ncbi:MAG: AAA-like domain-containing protein [Myxococcota bacterium]
MERYFNTSGPLNAAEHYTLDPLQRLELPEVLSLIDQQKYFSLHAPRQTGRTTYLKALARYLNDEGRLRCLYVSVKQDQAAHQDFEKGVAVVMSQIAAAAQEQLHDDFVAKNWPNILETSGGAANTMLHTLTKWCDHSPKPMMILIDDIDALAGSTLIAMLHQLRVGYCDRNFAPFPQSVVLCGMRHLFDYQVEFEFGVDFVPYNINSESLQLKNFSIDDIQALYMQHTQETKQPFATGVYERVFELTQGQPWLVNALAYDACFQHKDGQDRSKSITVADIDAAKERVIQRRETHLDQLMAKMQQDRVQPVIESIMSGKILSPTKGDINYTMDLGLIRQDETNSIVIANPIYREVIAHVASGA